jgi:hypothetical protein
MSSLGMPAVTRAELPTHWQALLFETKAWAFRLQRLGRDILHGPRRHPVSDALAEAPVLAESVAPLWPHEEDSQALVAGKIHNLRRAVRGLHGIVVPAAATLGFWRQVGRATRLRGFARGRELREGCLVPSTGGGLCQLSNAIYDAALRAGLEVVERHRHSRVVPGSLAEHDRDAVVFWNYRDLRLRSANAWRLEAWLDAENLHVRIRGLPSAAAPVFPLAPSMRKPAGPMDDCTGCGQTDCHRHAPEPRVGFGRTWLVDEDWPEFAAYRRDAFAPGDRIVAVQAGWRMRIAGLAARVLRRFRLWRGDPLPRARLHGQRLLARALASRLGARDVRLVLPQGVLPYLWEAGELQGRRFDVCMTALPMREIQRRLDDAARRHPDSPTLRDFRVDDALVRAEEAALAQATRWITPHAGILTLAGERGCALPWSMPRAAVATDAAHAKPRVFLAASSLARKGAIELRDALRGLPVQLGLPPGAWETTDFWHGIDVVPAPSMAQGVAEADVVVLPAWVEHQPRGLLLALAQGKPVIATTACGLPHDMSWQCVEAGDVEALRATILHALPTLVIQ